MGNLCEHILKVISVWRKRSHAVPSISLLQYHRALLDMLHCPPHDSLIRDHAVSLAVFVQNQLNGLNLESSNSTMDQAALADKDRELVNEGPISEEVLSHNENSCADEHVAVSTEMSSPVACGNSLNNEGCGEEITSEMDVDPSSICISPPGLHSVDEVVSGGVLSGSRQRPLFNTETEDLLSVDDALTNSNGYEDDILNENCKENVMNTDPVSLDIPCSTMEFVEQCTVPHPNDLHSHDVNPTVISKVSDGKTVNNKTSPSSSVPVEVAADIAFTLDRVGDNMKNGSDCSRDLKLVGNVMVVNSEPLLKFSSTSRCNEEEVPVVNGVTEKPSSVTESHLTQSRLQEGADSINNNAVIRQSVVSDINVSSAEGDASGESANAF